jgi:hypothetical protein
MRYRNAVELNSVLLTITMVLSKQLSMETLAFTFVRAILIGLGVTLTFDLWRLFVKQAFKLAPSNSCLVGRWLAYYMLFAKAVRLRCADDRENTSCLMSMIYLV